MRLFVLFFLLAGAALAGEYAVLASGARLRIDRHEADGAKVRLYHGTGFVELDSAVVRSYEAEEYAAAVPELTPEPQPESPPRRARRWNWRTQPPTATVCRGNWCAV